MNQAINDAHVARSSLARTAGLAGIALLIGAVVLAYANVGEMKEALRVERLSLSQAASVEALEGMLKEAEALQRGYLMTGEPDLLARYDTLRAKASQRASALTASFESQETRTAAPAFERAVAERLQAIGETMKERQARGAQEAMRLAQAPERVAVAATAEQSLEDMRRRVQRVGSRRGAAVAENLGFLERGMLVGILAAGALLGWAMRAGFRQEASRRAAEAALQAKSRELRLLIDAVPAAIAFIDRDERVITHNRLISAWLGQPDARIEGRPLRELLDADAYAFAAPYVRRALSGERVTYDRVQRMPDGRARDVAAELVPHVSQAGEVLGYFALLTDVTDLKNLSRMKSDFVSMVSHELRTPATAIRGALGMLAGGAAGLLPAEAARLVGMANAGCEQLVRLVDDLASIERIEAGEISVNESSQDLALLLPVALAAAGPQAAKAGVRLQIRGDLPPAQLRTDADRVKQVLANLLANAIQFSPRGGVVQADLEARGKRLRVSIRDHGPGVSETMRPRLFEKFAQDPSMARGSTGRFGLGLAASKLLIERLGGSIGYEPAEGGGALFWFELPADNEALAA